MLAIKKKDTLGRNCPIFGVERVEICFFTVAILQSFLYRRYSGLIIKALIINHSKLYQSLQTFKLDPEKKLAQFQGRKKSDFLA